MSHFKPYPAYKESGVEWLGEVPESWSVFPVKWVGWLKGGAGFPHDKQGIDTNELDFHKVNALASADSEGILQSSENTITRETAKELGAYIFPKGAIVFAKVGAALLLGRLRTINTEACLDNNMMGFVVFQEKFANQFILYSMGTVRFDLIANPGAVPSLNEGQIGNYRLAIPSKTEQTQIARFLDHETARIDALIAEQQRLIELLKEKRQAVISHAVTKGLDPTVPMKDSGVEWLGEVPAHWVVKPMKYLVEDGESVSYGIVQPGDHQDEGVPFIQTTNMSSGDFSFDALQRTSPEIEANYPRSRLHGGEVILGIRATIGAAFVVPESLKNINLSRGVARIECSEQVLAGYLVYFLTGRAAFEYWGLAKQGSTFSEVSIATVRELPVTVPPLIEQQELIDHMEQTIKSLDDLTLIGERTMALLKERRSALISAAVTGKIDVRDWTPPANASSPKLEQEVA